MKQLLGVIRERENSYDMLNTDINQTGLLTTCWDSFFISHIVEVTISSLTWLSLLKTEVWCSLNVPVVNIFGDVLRHF